MNDRDRAREALERAADGEAPGVDRLVARVPAIMREAQRRRETDAPALVQLIRLARASLPRMALATGIVAATAIVLFVTDRRETEPINGSRAVDELILTGQTSVEGDLLLQALIREPGDG